MIVRVAIAKEKIPLLDYKTTKNLKLGQIVLVPFRKKILTAVVWQLSPENPYENLKEVYDVCQYYISEKYIEFINKAYQYWCKYTSVYNNSLLLTTRKHTAINHHATKYNSICL